MNTTYRIEYNYELDHDWHTKWAGSHRSARKRALHLFEIHKVVHATVIIGTKVRVRWRLVREVHSMKVLKRKGFPK